ncbi:uncharacterized protein CDAR_390901 [Caerostris darwini]|uniref:RNase H type-1 domain-containing protein n=1 Tax=Caerostris darwini TaxID=1538125 RepID=A0AAV4UA57_9ARAC|nr:uncharacterized protein CDAR_390901 [Caerostris darwini]
MAATSNIRSLIDSIVEVLFPQGTEQNETPEQKNKRVTVAQYGTSNVDRMITKQEISMAFALKSHVRQLRSLVVEKTRSLWCVCIISLDVAGAFDNVWWPSVLYLLTKAMGPKTSMMWWTVSTYSLQVIVGVAPLDLRALEVHAKFLMTVIKIPAVHGTEFNPSEYESVADLWDTHPALRKSVLFNLPEPFGSEIEMYKDRPGMEGRYGSDLVVLYYGQKIHSEMRRLEDHASVYQAELVAIHMALTWTLKLKEVKSINIYSDSRSALQALADPSNTSELVLEVKRMHELATARRMVYLHSGICWLSRKRVSRSVQKTLQRLVTLELGKSQDPE